VFLVSFISWAIFLPYEHFMDILLAVLKCKATANEIMQKKHEMLIAIFILVSKEAHSCAVNLACV